MAKSLVWVGWIVGANGSVARAAIVGGPMVGDIIPATSLDSLVIGDEFGDGHRWSVHQSHHSSDSVTKDTVLMTGVGGSITRDIILAAVIGDQLIAAIVLVVQS